MSNAVLKGNASGTGTVTLETPNTNTDRTITLPDATGTVMVSGNMPAFSAYASSNQSVTGSTYTKVACNTEEFDTNNNYDNATNYRFLPNVAGYYQVTGQISYTSSVTTRAIIVIYKNGSAFKFGNDATVQVNSLNVTSLIYFNGSTDYVELYGWISGTGTLQFQATLGNNTYFQACLVRVA